jgi:hypothetical protein
MTEKSRTYVTSRKIEARSGISHQRMGNPSTFAVLPQEIDSLVTESAWAKASGRIVEVQIGMARCKLLRQRAFAGLVRPRHADHRRVLERGTRAGVERAIKGFGETSCERVHLPVTDAARSAAILSGVPRDKY